MLNTRWPPPQREDDLYHIVVATAFVLGVLAILTVSVLGITGYLHA